MKTGNTYVFRDCALYRDLPQWSPVMKTGNTGSSSARCPIPSGLNGARS